MFFPIRNILKTLKKFLLLHFETLPESIHFVTSNPNKLRELSNLLQIELLHLDLDLMEIQTSDLKLLVENKLSQAWMGLQNPVIVEDTSLYFEAWGNLPGPLVKLFVKDLGAEGMYRSLQNFEDFRAKAVCCLGYTSDGVNLHMFEGEVRGQIVAPRGSSGFGWDPIFNPEGSTSTFAELDEVEKGKYSPRGRSASRFRAFLAGVEDQS